jgi:hypothetical protein
MPTVLKTKMTTVLKTKMTIVLITKMTTVSVFALLCSSASLISRPAAAGHHLNIYTWPLRVFGSDSVQRHLQKFAEMPKRCKTFDIFKKCFASAFW